MSRILVERVSYFAATGQAAAVLAVRQEACAVRRELGLPIGEVRALSGRDGPDVVWECRFPGLREREVDASARDSSREFSAVRTRMVSITTRIERTLEEVTAPLQASWVGDRDLSGWSIVPEAIHFESEGNSLVGYLYRPPGSGPFPCMVTNHGSGISKGTTDVCRPACAALLMSWGIASFLPHRRGYGNSGGTPWQEEVVAERGGREWDRQLTDRLDRESDDIVRALAVVSQLSEIDPGHVGVMGSSFGGTTSLLAASKSEGFRCAIDFAGAAMVWEEITVLQDRMKRAASELTQPIYLIQSKSDYSTGPTRELTEHLGRESKVFESRIYPKWGLTPDEGHFFESRGMQIWAPDVRRFLERWL